MAEELVIPIKADDSQVKKASKSLGGLEGALTSLYGKLGATRDGMGSLGSAISGLVSGFDLLRNGINTLIVAPLANAVNGFVALGDQISKTSQRVGIGVETLGGLKFAAEQCGANFDILTAGIQKFQNTLGAAQMGDAASIGKLGNVGLNLDDLSGLSNEDQLMKLADHIAAIGDKSEQTRVAMELFGKAGFKLLPFFQEGSEGIKKLIAEGKDIGAVMGEEATAEAVAMADAMNRMKTSAAGVTNVLVSMLAPAIIKTFDSITAVTKSTGKFLKNWGDLVGLFAGAVALFLSWPSILAGIKAAYVGLTAGVSALNTAMAMNPIGAIAIAAVAAGVGLVALIRYLTKTTTEENRLAETTKAADVALEGLNKTVESSKKKIEETNAESGKLQETIDRLEELAEKENLSNSEMEEQARIIDELNAKLPELGATIDENTGKVKDLNQAMVDTLKIQARQQAQTIRSEQTKLQEQLDATAGEKENIENQRAALWSRRNGGNAEEIDKQITTLGDKWNELDEAEKKGKEQLAALEQDWEKVWDDLGKSIQKNMEATVKRNLKQADAFDEKEKVAQMTPEQKAMYDIDQKYAKPRKNLQAARDALNQEKENRSLTGEWTPQKQKQLESVQARLDALDTRQEAEKKALLDQWQREVEEWTDTLPEVGEKYEPFEKKDARIVAAEAAVQTARDKQATAILNNEGVQEADQELETAQQALAKTIAEVSGENRVKAKEELDAAQKAYDEASKIFTDKATLEPLAKAVTEAQEKYNRENEAYFNAVGSMRKEKEEEIEEVMQTTFSTSGTFSAYGMDAAVASDIPQQTLDVLRALLDNTDDIKEEQKNNGVFTA